MGFSAQSPFNSGMMVLGGGYSAEYEAVLLSSGAKPSFQHLTPKVWFDNPDLGQGARDRQPPRVKRPLLLRREVFRGTVRD
jgi:hypothetical protein